MHRLAQVSVEDRQIDEKRQSSGTLFWTCTTVLQSVAADVVRSSVDFSPLHRLADVEETPVWDEEMVCPKLGEQRSLLFIR